MRLNVRLLPDSLRLLRLTDEVAIKAHQQNDEYRERSYCEHTQLRVQREMMAGLVGAGQHKADS
jgi:hypothetical protein